MRPINSYHPECKDDEIFITVANESGYEDVAWKTKRRGTHVYDDEGRLADAHGIFPVFASRTELAGRHLTFGPPTHFFQVA